MKTWQTKSGYKIVRVLTGRSNVFLLTNGERNILIDTGTKYMWPGLKRGLDHLQVPHIDCLILTHAHMDHAANARAIKEKYEARVIVHRLEAPYLVAGENIVPKGTNPITRTFVRLLGKRLLTLYRYEPCAYDFLVDSVFDLHDFGFNAFILHTPGHTKGSMSVIVDREVAIVGDTMFGVFKWSVFPPYADGGEQMIESWGKLLATGCSVFLPSHGSADDRRLVQRCYDRRARRLDTEPRSL